MKWINGPITNPKTGIKKDIVVKSVLGCKPRDFALGLGAMLGGAWYLCNACFKNGAYQADVAEMQVFEDLDLFVDKEDKTE